MNTGTKEQDLGMEVVETDKVESGNSNNPPPAREVRRKLRMVDIAGNDLPDSKKKNIEREESIKLKYLSVLMTAFENLYPAMEVRLRPAAKNYQLNLTVGTQVANLIYPCHHVRRAEDMNSQTKLFENTTLPNL